MYKRKDRVDTCCVLRVSLDVLQLPGVVIADRNASKDWVRFLEPSQWRFLDFERIFADDWTDSNFFEYIDKKARNAQVLVPHSRVPLFSWRLHPKRRCRDAVAGTRIFAPFKLQ